MYEVRKGGMTPGFLPKIKLNKNKAGSMMDLTRENLEFKITCVHPALNQGYMVSIYLDSVKQKSIFILKPPLTDIS